MPYTVESPRPVPFPGSFVVKNGSKMRSRISSGMPCPVSLTTSVHAPRDGERARHASTRCESRSSHAAAPASRRAR